MEFLVITVGIFQTLISFFLLLMIRADLDTGLPDNDPQTTKLLRVMALIGMLSGILLLSFGWHLMHKTC